MTFIYGYIAIRKTPCPLDEETELLMVKERVLGLKGVSRGLTSDVLESVGVGVEI